MRILLLVKLLLGSLLLTPSSGNATAYGGSSISHRAVISPSPIVIVSWNLQWLSVRKQNSVISRTTADYRQLAKIIKHISPDILAFQEVDSAEAIRAILPASDYTIYLSERQHRPRELFPDNNQFTGFAVKSYLTVRDPPDVRALNIALGNKQKSSKAPGKLRYGSYLIVKSGENSELHLLNIHLKSGCFSRRYRLASKPCRILKRQSDVLAEWIRQRQINGEHFIVLGDFNHQLNTPRQWLLSALNKGLTEPMVNITDDIAASCTVKNSQQDRNKPLRHYRTLIDHIISSKSIAEAVHLGGRAYQYQYSIDNIMKLQLSDHCPLVLHLPQQLM